MSSFDYRFRPVIWTGPSTPRDQRRSRYTFRSSWPSTLDLLERELDHLRARDVVLQADFREEDLRMDGMPRANARQPIHPGVRISFDSKHGPLTYATDSCEFWQHNIRSIALGLEALRAVDRYGVTKSGEQYRGWLQIEAGPGSVSSLAEARRLIGGFGGIKAALRATHPDNGGDPADFHRVQVARQLLTEAGDLA